MRLVRDVPWIDIYQSIVYLPSRTVSFNICMRPIKECVIAYSNGVKLASIKVRLASNILICRIFIMNTIFADDEDDDGGDLSSSSSSIFLEHTFDDDEDDDCVDLSSRRRNIKP